MLVHFYLVYTKIFTSLGILNFVKLNLSLRNPMNFFIRLEIQKDSLFLRLQKRKFYNLKVNSLIFYRSNLYMIELHVLECNMECKTMHVSISLFSYTRSDMLWDIWKMHPYRIQNRGYICILNIRNRLPLLVSNQ